MNIYAALNQITEYIEEHLEDKIDYNTLARIMGVNSYTMQKIFSLITNVPLSEYIRKRRLSQAGFDLYQKNAKVMDIAIKYQYDNATSFARAFATFHGIKPSLVNKETKLKNFPRILFDEKVKSVSELEYEIIELEKMELYGIGIKTNNKKIGYDAPKFFEETEQKYQEKYGNIKYGMVTYQDETREECTGYYILYDQKIKEFERITIPASKWLVFKINSQNSKDIQKISHQFYMEFLPSCKYSFNSIPELEWYHDNQTDFLVPIE